MGPEDLDSIPQVLWGAVLDRLRSKLPPSPIDPLGGFDNAPVPPPAPQIPVAPWTVHLGGNEATIALPANHGAKFEGYLNYNFNPFSPMGITGGGLRYRYQF